MAHTKPEQLADLEQELEALRALAGLREKSPGVFYLRSLPFLHFHDKHGVRWADMKVKGGGWQKLEIDFKAGKAARARFLKEACAGHASLSAGKKK
jgi:hypothetical protein